MSLPEVGDEILGKYRINKRLGEGGMGVVYAATHIDLQETVAIKMLTPDLARREEIVARFMREARAAAKIKSDHAVRVLDVGKLENSVPYMVMEFLDGEDLEHVLQTRGQLPLRDAITYIREAAEALGEAHRLGIVHRDIKPANLFLAKKSNGTRIVKVLDFGISKVANDGLGSGGQTRTQAVMGTPMYMSPEQLRSSRDVDGRADVWSLGVVFYELLTGGFPFEGESIPVICSEILAAKYKPIRDRRPDLPVEVESIIGQCLEKERDKRFASVEAFVLALAPFSGVDAGPAGSVVVVGTGARSGGNWTQTGSDATLIATDVPKVEPRRSVRAIAMAVIAAVFLLGGGLLAWSRLSGESSTTVAQDKPVESKPTAAVVPSVVPAGQAVPAQDPLPLPTAAVSTALSTTAAPTADVAVGKPTSTGSAPGGSTAKAPAVKPTANTKVFDVGGRK